MVTVSEAYFDESYEDQTPRVLCVAGYVFRKSRAIEFGKEWSNYLRRQGLPYFHANECAHRAGVFKGWSKEAADAVSRKLIALTTAKSDFGMAVAVDQDCYAAVFNDPTMIPTAYAFALTNCCYQIAHWRLARGINAPTSFFFEQGHRHANDAHMYLRFLLRSDDFGKRLGYRAHSFVPKETPQVQPADLLAWLWRLHAKRTSEGSLRPQRADLTALWRPKDRFVFFGRPELERFKARVRAETAGVDGFIRQLARDIGLPEDRYEEIANFRPDYRAPIV